MTTKSPTPVPTLVRMEHLTPQGWTQLGSDLNLLHPDRVPGRYRANGKFVRCTELDAKLAPTGRVWVADDVPRDPSVLVRSEGHAPWKLPEPGRKCSLCGDKHPAPYDGSCLL